MCVEIVNEIHRNRKNGHVYSISEMKELTTKFLKNIGYDGSEAVPIIKIAQKCGFVVICGYMKDKKKSGFICISDKNKSKYHYSSEKIIGINREDEIGHQRFVIAHELAHYLFDYEIGKKTYFDEYEKNSHKSLKEQTANVFAANLLMPAADFALKFEENRTMKENIENWAAYFEVQEKAVRKRVAEVMANGI